MIFLFHWALDWLESSIIKVLYINQYHVLIYLGMCAYCALNVKYEWHPMSSEFIVEYPSIHYGQTMLRIFISNQIFKFLLEDVAFCLPLHVLVMVRVIIGSHYKWNETFKYKFYAFERNSCLRIHAKFKDIGNENWCLLDSFGIYL